MTMRQTYGPDKGRVERQIDLLFQMHKDRTQRRELALIPRFWLSAGAGGNLSPGSQWGGANAKDREMHRSVSDLLS